MSSSNTHDSTQRAAPAISSLSDHGLRATARQRQPAAQVVAELRHRGLRGDRGAIQCPLPGHGRGRGDLNPSLSVKITDSGRVLLSCKTGCGLDAVVEALGFRVRDLFPTELSGASRPAQSTNADRLIQTDAERVWCLALARAQGDADLSNRDEEVRQYLQQRGLGEARRRSALGILSTDQPLPNAIAWWPRHSYRITVPLYDQEGRLATLQARAISNRSPKTMFPRGSKIAGTVFASEDGLNLLRGVTPDDRRVLYGEGLTDYLAYVSSCPFPVLCAPGTSVYVAGIGDWARDRIVVLVPDTDPAGRNVATNAAKAAYGHGARRVVVLSWDPPATDACDYLAAHGTLALRELLASVPMESQ